MPVILKMEENYPNIYSGIVSFENRRTGVKVRLKLPDDLEKGIYGIRHITMDTGAIFTVFPLNFAEMLSVSKPPKDEKEYYAFSGVGGTCVCFYSPNPIRIEVEDGKSKLSKTIYPFFMMNYAPSVTSEGRLLSQKYQPHMEEIVNFISPPFQYCNNNFTVEVNSPIENFPPENRRLNLEVDIGQNMNYILIGRDWQEGFNLTFRTSEIVIE